MIASAKLQPLSSGSAGFLRSAGFLCLTAGIVGAAAGVFLVFVPEAVTTNRYSYPLDAGAFIAIQAFFAIHHVGLLAGQAALWPAGALGRSRVAWWGHLVGLAGIGLLIATEVLAIGAADFDYDGSYTTVLDGLYGVAATGAGGGLVVAGVMGLRTGAWSGWRRWLPFLTGAYVFLPMTPAISIGHDPARFAIAGWMLLYALIGLALLRTSTEAR